MSEFFTKMWQWIVNSISISVFDFIDIVIVTVAIYHILKFFKNTRAMNVLKGVALLVIALAIASWLQLPTIEWLLSSVVTSGIIIVFVLFQPELRLVLENFGRSHFSDTQSEQENIEATSSEIVKACENLSLRRVGALIVFEQKNSLKDISETGTMLNASISSGLIENIFEPNTPLHDGATIISGNRIVASGCFLPLSENPNVDKKLGTRHRAALGISERSDAIVIIISEETGVISVARNGEFARYLDLAALHKLLREIYEPTITEHSKFKAILNKLFGKEHTDNEN